MNVFVTKIFELSFLREEFVQRKLTLRLRSVTVFEYCLLEK